MIYKEKTWVWKLTGPFAARNYTTIGDILYYPKGSQPWLSKELIAHEQIHSRQQKEVGLYKFIFLYLFCAPILWNPWRFKWEYEAYTKGSLWPDEITRRTLKSESYGWLLNA